MHQRRCCSGCWTVARRLLCQSGLCFLLHSWLAQICTGRSQLILHDVNFWAVAETQSHFDLYLTFLTEQLPSSHCSQKTCLPLLTPSFSVGVSSLPLYIRLLLPLLVCERWCVAAVTAGSCFQGKSSNKSTVHCPAPNNRLKTLATSYRTQQTITEPTGG